MRPPRRRPARPAAPRSGSAAPAGVPAAVPVGGRRRGGGGVDDRSGGVDDRRRPAPVSGHISRLLRCARQGGRRMSPTAANSSTMIPSMSGRRAGTAGATAARAAAVSHQCDVDSLGTDPHQAEWPLRHRGQQGEGQGRGDQRCHHRPRGRRHRPAPPRRSSRRAGAPRTGTGARWAAPEPTAMAALRPVGVAHGRGGGGFRTTGCWARRRAPRRWA